MSIGTTSYLDLLQNGTLRAMVRTIFWFFVLFLALSFFGISIRAIIESPTGQANLAYLTFLAVSAWQWFVQYVGGLRASIQGI